MEDIYRSCYGVTALKRRISSYLASSEEIKEIAIESMNTDYILIYVGDSVRDLSESAIERLFYVAEQTGAVLVYADRFKLINGVIVKAPLLEYQCGSLRDDFDFGSVMLFRSDLFRESSENSIRYRYAGFYDLRLKLSKRGELLHLNEYLYYEEERDFRKSGERQFDYIDPKNRDVQIEMEQAFTAYLRSIGGYIPPSLIKEISLSDLSIGVFEFEASVIIPVLNRVNTIGNAIDSALNQECSFPFNVIVVDNHSSDGTGEVIAQYSYDKRVVRIVPKETDLGIGGCWNSAIFDRRCGRFAVQLDSDDLYSDKRVLQKMVEAFYTQRCAMLIGSYRMVDFDLNPIPPGVIDHREWTFENGHNNALRINGMGAPRAFFTPIVREIRFPNTSYGEDYAMGLRISMRYKIGRLYEVLYLCRRWSGNTDSDLSIERQNINNFYKDSLRSMELKSRKQVLSNL